MTPRHSPMGLSLSQFALASQFAPPVVQSDQHGPVRAGLRRAGVTLSNAQAKTRNPRGDRRGSLVTEDPG